MSEDLEAGETQVRRGVAARMWTAALRVIVKLDDIVRLAKNIAFIFVFAMAAPFVYKVLSRSTIVVQDVSVPQELEARGLTGRVFSQRVIDKIIEVANDTDALKEREDTFGLSQKNQRPDIDLPITIAGINFETLLSFLKTAFGGQDIRVVGEVVAEQAAADSAPARYSVRFRVAKIGTIYRSTAPSTEIDALAERAALGVLEEYEPITMAYYYRGRRDFASAFRMTEKAILKKAPGDVVWAHFVRALISVDQARWDEAEDELRFVLERNPAFPRARNNLSRVLRRKGDFAGALAEAEKAIAVEPDRGQSYGNKAWALVGLGRSKEALPWLEKQIAVEPDNETGHIDMGDYHRQLRELDLAALHYRMATDIKPNASQIYVNLAGVLGDLGRWDEAETATMKSLNFNPRNGVALGYVGYIALQRGDYERARKFYTDAIAVDPSYFRSHIGHARIAMHERDYARADELLEKARAANPRWWDVYKYKGDLAELRGDSARALSLYEEAEKLNERAPDVHARIAWLAERSGDHAKALKHAETAVRLAPYLFRDVAFVLAVSPF